MKIKVYRNAPGDWIVESPSNVGSPFARYNFAGYVEAPNTKGESLDEDTWAFIGEYEYVSPDLQPVGAHKRALAAADGLEKPKYTGPLVDHATVHLYDPHGTSGSMGRSGGVT
jgi:hypothetical protein